MINLQKKIDSAQFTVLVFWIYMLIAGVLHSPSALAGDRIIKEDLDNDGQIDRIVHLGQSGDVVQLEADTNGDLKMDTFQYYKRGTVERIDRDTDADGHIDERDLLENGKTKIRHGLNMNDEIVSTLTFDGEQRPLEWRRDTNGDGVFDVSVRISKGKPISKEEDTNHDGRMDRFTAYDDGGGPLSVREFAANPNEPVKTVLFREGELYSVEQIDNGRMVFIRFQNNKPVKQTIDENRDGRPEQTITYDKQGKVDSAFSDTNQDGRIDTWQYYRQGVLHRTEQDRNHDGEVDAKSEYDGSRQIRTLMDNDEDGHLETRTVFGVAEWTKVTEVVDKAGRCEQRLSYSVEVLRKNEVFDTATGRLSNLEEFDQAGKIVMSKEAENGSGALNLTWRYDAEENAVAAEKDSDGDGLADIWYYYENGHVKRVEQDRNKDGKPDLWETYDAAQVLVHQSEDLDFDGTADIERRY
jgi:antitoxin component YwqK of YwqJK toxin-antitoxin module